MMHTCGTSMNKFIFVHALPTENVDWLLGVWMGDFYWLTLWVNGGGGGHGMKGS